MKTPSNPQFSPFGPIKCREKTLINTKFLNYKVCFGGPRSYWNTPTSLKKLNFKFDNTFSTWQICSVYDLYFVLDNTFSTWQICWIFKILKFKFDTFSTQQISSADDFNFVFYNTFMTHLLNISNFKFYIG